ncbi:MAG: hypothetical protein A2045_05730 [Rhodocyclales bacterium GWA2_65_20]|nr:MAG: hypothetical protein A2045_05730 [Rhodocyclales bacterium GWA2_65_20]
MKTKVLAIAVGIGVMVSLPVFAADHSIPTAPKNYLDMKNPLKVNKAVLERGEQVYERKCKKCHGANGDGKGEASDKLTIKPASFSAPGYLKGRSDGQLFFITEKGSPNTDMEAFGPGTETSLSKDDMWRVVAYIRKAFTK